MRENLQAVLMILSARRRVRGKEGKAKRSGYTTTAMMEASGPVSLH